MAKKSNDHVKAVVEHIKPEDSIVEDVNCDECTDCEVKCADIVEALDERAPVVTFKLEDAKEVADLLAGPTLHIVDEGDTYASIAARWCPIGMTKHEYATLLVQKNQGAVLSAGTRIKL